MNFSIFMELAELVYVKSNADEKSIDCHYPTRGTLPRYRGPFQSSTGGTEEKRLPQTSC